MLRRPKPYDLTTHDGKRVDWITKAALQKMERLLGYELSVTQGSYNKGGVSASAGTHDGGGVVDLAPYDWQSKVRAGRLCGFVAYYRSPDEGPWPAHVHMVLEADEKLSPSAERQVHAYHLGRNALADNGPDPHLGLVFRGFKWPYGGVVGLARWQRDQMRGKKRAAFLARLGQVVKGK